MNIYVFIYQKCEDESHFLAAWMPHLHINGDVLYHAVCVVRIDV